MHQNSPFLAQKMEKKIWGGGAQPPPYSAIGSRRGADCTSILWRSTSAPSAPRLSPRPPDFAPHFHIPSVPPPMSGAKEPQSESSRERNGQETKGPGSESARQRFGQGANLPGSYWPIRSRERIGPAAKRLGTVTNGT